MENNFDKYLQQQVDAGQFSPQGDDWQRFEQMLDQQPKKKRRFFFLWWGILASVLLSGALLTKDYFGKAKVLTVNKSKQHATSKSVLANAKENANNTAPEAIEQDRQNAQAVTTASSLRSNSATVVADVNTAMATNSAITKSEEIIALQTRENVTSNVQEVNINEKGNSINRASSQFTEKGASKNISLPSREVKVVENVGATKQKNTVPSQSEAQARERKALVSNARNNIVQNDIVSSNDKAIVSTPNVLRTGKQNSKNQRNVLPKQTNHLRSNPKNGNNYNNDLYKEPSTNLSTATKSATPARNNYNGTPKQQGQANLAIPQSKQAIAANDQAGWAATNNEEIDIALIDNGFKLEKGSPLYKKLAATYGANNITKLSSEKIAAAKAQLINSSPTSNMGHINFNDNDNIKKLKLFALTGVNINQGFADSVSSAKQGLTPFVGVGLSKMLSNKMGLRLDIVGTTYNQINHYKASPLYTYSFGRVADSFRLNYKKFSQIQVPLRLEYQMGKIVSLYAGGSASYLVDVGAKVQSGANAEIDQWGYRDGFNRLDIAATFGFGLHITKAISLESFYQQGFLDVTNNSFFNNTQNDLQKKVQIGLKYNFKK